MEYVLQLLGYQKEYLYPIIYVKGNSIHNNIYMEDSHPNDRTSRYKAGQSKGKMRGLEGAGWIGYSKPTLS